MITRFQYEYEGGITYSRDELYHFYPDHVLKTTRNSAYAKEKGFYVERQPKGLATEKHEANRDELNDLLEVTRKSTEFKSGSPK